MTNLDMKAQMVVVLCSVATIYTITFCPFMLPLHMIHNGQLCSKFTFSAGLPSSNRNLKKLIQIWITTMFQLIQAPSFIPSHPSLQLAHMSAPAMLLQAKPCCKVFPTPCTPLVHTVLLRSWTPLICSSRQPSVANYFPHYAHIQPTQDNQNFLAAWASCNLSSWK